MKFLETDNDRRNTKLNLGADLDYYLNQGNS